MVLGNRAQLEVIKLEGLSEWIGALKAVIGSFQKDEFGLFGVSFILSDSTLGYWNRKAITQC
jgi:hypothetical protein